MPFLTLQPEELIRLSNDTQTSAAVSSRHLSSLYSRRILFPFEDPYDVPWQKYVSSPDSSAPDKIKNLFDPKYPVNNSQIYDQVTLPFSVSAANGIFKQLADTKSSFLSSYTNRSGSPFELRVTDLDDDKKFLDHVFNAFYRQSFYRHAKFQMFKSTTELGPSAGFFIRRALWGYFTKDALSDLFSYNIGDGIWVNYKNSAKSSADIYVWDDRFDYVNWANETSAVKFFKENPEWVGLSSWQNYRGWLKYACSNPNSHVDISSYYAQKIKDIEHKDSISPYNVALAEVVNELYENLTQINRHISRELSLLFDTTDDTDDPPPPELIENGYITITFSNNNCFADYYKMDDGSNPGIHDKLGTLGLCPFRSTSDNNKNFTLTCEYGQIYYIPDYERMLTIGREDELAFPVISSYNKRRSEDKIWCLATNPYDVYQNPIANRFNPPTTNRNNGRAKYYSELSCDFNGEGVWYNATALSTKTQEGEAAYAPCNGLNPQRDGEGILATPYAYWCEKEYYDTKQSYNGRGTENPKFEIFTVSNISSQVNSSYHYFQRHRPSFLSCGSNHYPRQTENCKYFPDYMVTKIRAVADKTYYPVFDKDASIELSNLRQTPFLAEFSNANIRCLRTGINYDHNDDRRSTSKIKNGRINEDPYYMKYRRGYSGDSPEEYMDQTYSKGDDDDDKEDYKAMGTCGTGTYLGASRPINEFDDQWALVKDALMDDSVEWRGDTFKFNKGIFYINPNKVRWELILIGIVKYIGFSIKTDILLRGSYGVTNTIKTCFWGRASQDWGDDNDKKQDCDIIAPYPYDHIPTFVKENRVDLISNGDRYVIPIAANTSLIHDENILKNTFHDDVKFKFNGTEFSNKFHANTAQAAWNTLLSYMYTVFPGSGDTGLPKKHDTEPLDWKSDFVFWMSHLCSNLKGNAQNHELKYDPNNPNSERFFMVIGGFSFGLEYSDDIQSKKR